MYTCKTDQSSEGGKCEELTYTWVQLQLLHLHCLKSGLSETPLRGEKNGNFVASKPVKTLTHSQKKHKTTVCSVWEEYFYLSIILISVVLFVIEYIKFHIQHSNLLLLYDIYNIPFNRSHLY